MSESSAPEEPAPARSPAELRREIEFWLQASKEFVDGHDEGDAGVLRYALEFFCLSMIRDQLERDTTRH